ncbi:thiol-disulfide oxidoreductase DCC family protein [Listeria costaricensis]|uniref:thiol-disulfide oxidoreductase DCC family protein n=1 Tax=Listeria costaricensis TaxID=2026604 RepID=UPI000C082A83|nr:DUF393 domain-containing protein [Listeria costaricensis]
MVDIVLYDEKCSFCQLSKSIMEKLDWRKKLLFFPLQSYKGTALEPEQLKLTLHVVRSNGRVYRGFYAVRRILTRLPLLKIPSILCYLPFVPRLGEAAYRFVARRRNRIMRLFKMFRLSKSG